jgi:hypothetical protein
VSGCGAFVGWVCGGTVGVMVVWVELVEWGDWVCGFGVWVGWVCGVVCWVCVWWLCVGRCVSVEWVEWVE